MTVAEHGAYEQTSPSQCLPYRTKDSESQGEQGGASGQRTIQAVGLHVA